MVNILKTIQIEEGLDKVIKPRMDPNEEKLIEQRIEDLFPTENFYFYKIYDEKHGDKEYVRKRNELEEDGLLKLIEENMFSDRYFIKEGLLEPV